MNSLSHGYLTVDQFGDVVGSNGAGDMCSLLLMSLNVRSFYRHRNELVSLLASLEIEPDILVLTETWLTNCDKEGAFLTGYNAFHTVREGGRSGGVSVFYKDHISNLTFVEGLSVCTDNIEACGVMMEINGTKMCVIGVYRPHSGTLEEFTAELGELFGQVDVVSRGKLCILGDFNANLLNVHCDRISTFINFMQSHHLISTIGNPTRFPPDLSTSQPTLLDHIWVNFLDFSISAILDVDITDHCPVFIVVKVPGQVENAKVKYTFRDQSETNLENFYRRLGEVVWSFDRYNSIDDRFSYFNKTINDVFCESCPIKVKQVSSKRLQKPWLTGNIIKSIKLKSHYFKLYKAGLITKEENNQYKNRLNSTIRQAKRSYYHNYFATHRSNMKKYWSGVRELIGRVKAKRDVIESINVDGSIVSDGDIIAGTFNSYFSNVAYNLREKLPSPDNISVTDFIDNCPNSFYLYPVTIPECENVINNLKNTSYGVNVISTRLLKLISKQISEQLTLLINESFNTGVFPSSLKVASITPVYKAGDPLLVENYRPISVLPLFSKVVEKCMAIRMTKFMTKYSILSRCQFGFQKGRSTCDAVSSLVDFVYEQLNNKKHNIALFLDLCKAYDTVDHGILLDKLYCYGFRGTVWQWFRSYLSDRQHFVKIGSSVSDRATINISIPQGSVLGCYLFLLYINDLPKVSNLLKPFLFADDTALVGSGSNFEELVSEFNGELTCINGWLTRNKLSLNVNKSVALIISNRTCYIDQSLKLVINCNDVEYCCEAKYLGVILDSSLNFSSHISKISSKVSKCIGIMYRAANIVPSYVLTNMYYTLIYPYLIYCILIWGNAADIHLNRLLLLQKKAVRVICGSDYLAHSDPLFLETNILKIRDIFKYFCCRYVFKNYEEFSLSSHDHATRSKLYYLVPQFQRLHMSQRSLAYVVPVIYNEIPHEIKQIKYFKSFSKNIKSHFLNKYVTNP